MTWMISFIIGCAIACSGVAVLQLIGDLYHDHQLTKKYNRLTPQPIPEPDPYLELGMAEVELFLTDGN